MRKYFFDKDMEKPLFLVHMERDEKNCRQDEFNSPKETKLIFTEKIIKINLII